MDLNKFAKSFESMDYDLKKNKVEITLREIRATFIITEFADISTACDFIIALLNSEDNKLMNNILVQESVSKSFLDLLNKKIKNFELTEDVKKLSSKGFEIIGNRIVKCTRNMIHDNESSVVCLEIFRTTKEGISLSKNDVSVGLWCEKMSVAFEYINMLNSQQIWLNSSFGMTNAKIPFLSLNDVICEDGVKKLINDMGALFELSGNVQFQTTFQNNGKFKTCVIPFGETFAN